MAGTKTGGTKAAATNKAKHGADFYARIGAMGGKKGRTGGFAANPALARIAGAKGGRISRRGKKKDSAAADQPLVAVVGQAAPLVGARLQAAA